ncbi:MAG: glycosyl transferase family 28 [Chitinophagaceae bacterium]|nr:glycosyl transferase family 28 [Chitinophagaceae bacterium]
MIKGKNFNSLQHMPRVLVAPLDWGLGHATRCIPIILTLLNNGCIVIIAAYGPTKDLLQKEFPALEFVDYRGYEMQYSRHKEWFMVKLFLQFPKLFSRVRAEKRWLKMAIEKYKLDAVISDNRLGMSNKKITSIYITHQLFIKTGNSFLNRLAQKIHYHYINKYNACWVPDWAVDENLAGELSHPVKLPAIPVTFIGPLSRFEKAEMQLKFDCCCIISGPEPQRSIFENIILKQVHECNYKVVIVRGLPQQTTPPQIKNPLVTIINHLPMAEMSRLIQQSKLIISRSGYSTIMDLVTLQKKAVLVPTPGQTEQEYLAKYLGNKKIFMAVNQNNFCLADVLKQFDTFSFSTIDSTGNDLNDAIKNFVAGIFVD